MTYPTRQLSWLLAVALMGGLCPWSTQAGGKSYSSGGGRSYSSSSSHSSGFSGSHSSSSGGSGASHSFSSGSSGLGGSSSHSFSSGNKTFSSGGGKSYSAGSVGNDESRHGYSSGRSYSSSSGHLFSSGSGADDQVRPARLAAAPRKAEVQPSRFSFDTAAARAQKEETSRQEYQRFQQVQAPAVRPPEAAVRPSPGQAGSPAPPTATTPSYRVQPPPVIVSNPSSYRPAVYIPDTEVIVSRPVRTRIYFEPYYSRPTVIYHDPYSSLFWWWLLDRSVEDRAWWAYHHRQDMDPARYRALVAHDQQLEERLQQLEAQQTPRDGSYVPTGLDRDLMYSDHYVARTYDNRPSRAGQIAFWALGVPTALAFSGFFIWLIWFKRWQPAT